MEELTAPAEIYNKCYISSEAFKTLKITAGETVEGISGNKKNLETLVLADTVKTIGKFAFRNLTKLSSVTFSASLETIGQYAINRERDFRKIHPKIPNNIENSLQMIA